MGRLLKGCERWRESAPNPTVQRTAAPPLIFNTFGGKEHVRAETTMIRGEAAARDALDAAFRASSTLDASVEALSGVLPPQELSGYKHAVGHVMAEVFNRLIRPILVEHPELKPEGGHAWLK